MNWQTDDSESPRTELANRRVVVIGYGSQGRGQALNLRESGVHVDVALRPHGDSWQQAESEGWNPIDIRDAARNADVVCLLTPDMAQPKVYELYLKGKMKPGTTVLFSHGFNVHYGFIDGDENTNVILVAPKGPGYLVRREFQKGSGVPCLVGVSQDYDGSALAIAHAYADAIGGTRAGVIETTFAEETETDLFGEQAVLCGGVTELVVAGWETLVDAGYDPQIAYFECMHELKLIVDLLYEGGLDKMHRFVSDTAKYGDLTRGKRIVNAETRKRMQEVLEEVRDGSFAKEWRDEFEQGGAEYRQMLQDDRQHPIEAVGRELRKQFRWIEAREQEVTT